MIFAFNFDMISDKSVIFQVINDLNPELKGLFTRDKATWISKNIETVLGTW